MDRKTVSAFGKTVFNILKGSTMVLELDKFASEIAYSEHYPASDPNNRFGEIADFTLYVAEGVNTLKPEVIDKLEYYRLFVFLDQETPKWIRNDIKKIDLSGQYRSNPLDQITLTIEMAFLDDSTTVNMILSLDRKKGNWHFHELTDFELKSIKSDEDIENYMSAFIFENMTDALS